MIIKCNINKKDVSADGEPNDDGNNNYNNNNSNNSWNNNNDTALLAAGCTDKEAQ